MTDIPHIDGQIDIFEALGETPPMLPVPVFTVYTSPYDQRCGWCGNPGFLGGGAHRNPSDPDQSVFFQYCTGCQRKYGHPKTYTPTAIRVVDNRKDTP